MSVQLAELARTIIYPATTQVRSEIPLWMKFFCYEYNTSALGRSQIKMRTQGGVNLPTMSNLKAKIMVPAPANFETATNLKYAPHPTAASDLLPSGTIGDYANEFVSYISDKFSSVRDQIDQYTGNQLGYGRMLESRDVNDLTYEGSGSVRNYEIRLYLPCINVEDSKAAGEIVRAFEALCLPTATGFGSETALRYYHPPLWLFGIGPADNLSLDADWSGSTQISVLVQMKVRKQALDTNTVSAFSDGNVFKPVAYSVTLLFRELEPAFRAIAVGKSGIGILNRSGVITTGGLDISVLSR